MYHQAQIRNIGRIGLLWLLAALVGAFAFVPLAHAQTSDDATLSALTVDGTSVHGLAPDRALYAVGVASTVTEVTVAATANHGAATVAISPADADTNTTGHQVSLTAGRNTVTITVTAEDGTTMRAYSIDVNRGVTDDFGWNAANDFDTLAAAGNENPTGIWSDGGTMWVTDWIDDKIYAYNLSDQERDDDKDFDTLAAAGNGAPSGIWSDGTTMWVADNDDTKIYAYNLSTKARDAAKDFNTLAAADNDSPWGIWSDGTTMWVSDNADTKIYAYNLSDQERDDDKDFDTLAAADNDSPWGIWSDGATMWVSDNADTKIYAYNLSTKARDAAKDFNTLAAADNVNLGGIWSDGATMWVSDNGDEKIYAYNQAQFSDDNTLNALSASPKDINGFASDRTHYEVGVASTVDEATVSATANHSGATVAISPADADTNTTGHQVSLSAGRNEVTITVTAENNTTQDYTVSVNRGVTDEFGWNAANDFDTLDAAGNNVPRGIWSDGTTMWVAELGDTKIYAYNLSDQERDDTKDFDTLEAAGNNVPRGIWSDGTTMWVADSQDAKIYAYNLSTKARDADKDFDTLEAAGNDNPWGIWSDETTMWVADDTDDKIYAYNFSTKARDADKDFNTLDAAGNENFTGIWSNGTIMWVADWIDDKIYAYNLSTKARFAAKDFNTLIAAGFPDPQGIWSDGDTMWVADYGGYKIYAYNHPQPSDDATLSALTVNGTSVAGFAADRTTYEFGVASTVGVATVSATTNHGAATVAISPPDADANTTGHQVSLSAGPNEVTITVTAETNPTEDYTVSVNRGVSDRFGWNAAKDFDGLVAAGNEKPIGIWSDGTTMWVMDFIDTKIYAYNFSTKARDDTKDFNTLDAGNLNPRGLWSDGTTMWVADSGNDKIYAYSLSTKMRDAAKDFNTLDAGNNEPRGLWSDGTTMWVSNSTNNKIYAYNLSTKARDDTKDFNTLGNLGLLGPSGVWSNSATLWVVKVNPRKIYAYNLSTNARDAAKDFNTLDVGNANPQGLWSDGATMWVSDFTDGKLYSYNMLDITPPRPRNPGGGGSRGGGGSPGGGGSVPQQEPEERTPADLARQAADRFDDVDAGDYYASAVGWMIEHGITAGCDADSFCSDDPVTRTHFVTFLWRAAGSPDPARSGSEVFGDVDADSYAADAIGWAAEAGVTAGCQAATATAIGRFCPGHNVTRGQIATFLYRYVRAHHDSYDVGFDDVDADDYYALPVAWMANHGITAGCNETLFCPADPATRAQAAAFIYRTATTPDSWGSTDGILR